MKILITKISINLFLFLKLDKKNNNRKKKRKCAGASLPNSLYLFILKAM